MAAAVGPVLAALGVGLALAGSPGPVQAILLVESVRGGTGRGFKAQAGANLTLAVLLFALALGLATFTPGISLLRVLKVAGGAFLVWLAVDGYRSRHEVLKDLSGHRRLPPALRGLLAVVLLGGIGVRRAGARITIWIRSALALLLALLGVSLIISGLMG